MRNLVIILILTILAPTNIFADNTIKNNNRKDRAVSFNLSYTSFYQKNMFVVNTSGHSIFNRRRTYGFEIAYGASVYPWNKIEIELSFSIFYNNINKSLDVDANKIMDLENIGSDCFQYPNNDYFNADDLSGINFSFNSWYHFNEYKNSPLFMIGLSMYSPAKTGGIFQYNIYQYTDPINKQIKEIIKAHYYINPRLKYYPMLNLGLGYEYFLRRRSKLRFAFTLRYGNEMFLFGEYHTTEKAKFISKGKLYYNPSAMGLSVTYKF